MRHRLPPIHDPVPREKLSDLDKRFLEKKHEAPQKKAGLRPGVKEKLRGIFLRPDKHGRQAPEPKKATRKSPPKTEGPVVEPPKRTRLRPGVKERFSRFFLRPDKKAAGQKEALEMGGPGNAEAKPVEKKEAENAGASKPAEKGVAGSPEEKVDAKELSSLPADKKEAARPEKKGWFGKKQPVSKEARAAQIEKRMRHQKRKRRKLQRKSLQEYLDKAGYEVDAARLKRNIFHGLVIAFLVITAFVLVRAAIWGTHTTGEGLLGLVLFTLALWTVIFLAAALLAMGFVYFLLDYRIYRRTQQLEDVLPDFLQLASANIAAGMPIDRALWYSIRPSFGVLAKEMEVVAKATIAGEDLEQSLMRFTDRYDSVLLKRSVNILIEGLKSGGELADLLNKIALNIDELKIMRKEMAANVTTYAIFIVVAAVGIAPVLFGLATQLLQIIVKITGSIDLSSTSSFFSLGAVSPAMVANFTVFSYIMLIASSIFGACIVSVIQKGNVMSGIKTIPVYAVIAIVIYKLAVIILGSVFGSLV